MNAKFKVLFLILVLVTSMFSESESFNMAGKRVGLKRSFIQVRKDTKGALSPYLVSVTLKSQKTSLYHWKHKRNGPVLFIIILVML